MTDHTTITVTSAEATYTIQVPADLTCTDFIRYCAHLAKAQGYMLTNIADALEEVHIEMAEELNICSDRQLPF